MCSTGTPKQRLPVARSLACSCEALKLRALGYGFNPYLGVVWHASKCHMTVKVCTF